MNTDLKFDPIGYGRRLLALRNPAEDDDTFFDRVNITRRASRDAAEMCLDRARLKGHKAQPWDRDRQSPLSTAALQLLSALWSTAQPHHWRRLAKPLAMRSLLEVAAVNVELDRAGIAIIETCRPPQAGAAAEAHYQLVDDDRDFAQLLLAQHGMADSPIEGEGLVKRGPSIGSRKPISAKALDLLEMLPSEERAQDWQVIAVDLGVYPDSTQGINTVVSELYAKAGITVSRVMRGGPHTKVKRLHLGLTAAERQKAEALLLKHRGPAAVPNATITQEATDAA